MPLMSPAIGAKNFYAAHAHGIVLTVLDGAFYTTVVGRPAAAAIEFGRRRVEGGATAFTAVGALFKMIVVFSGKGIFCSRLSKDAVFLCREFLLPLLSSDFSTGYLLIFSRDKGQCSRVNTVSFSGRCARAIVKHMSKVSTTNRTFQFGAGITNFIIDVVF